MTTAIEQAGFDLAATPIDTNQMKRTPFTPLIEPVDEKLWAHNKFLSRFLEMNAEQELTDLYRIWPGISAISSCLERRCWSHWEQKIYPNQFIILVGEPATHKSLAISFAERVIRGAGCHVFPTRMPWERMLYKLAKLSEEQNFYCETTGEFVQHASGSAIADEFGVFVGYKDSERLQTLCQLYNCQENFEYSTHTHGDLNAKNVCLNLIGGVTPGTMLETLPKDANGGGFTSRIIFVFSELPKKQYSGRRTPYQIAREEKATDACIAILDDVRKMNGPFEISDAFNERFVYWREVESERKPPLPYYDENLQYYMGRRDTHFRKLAMAVSAGRSTEMVLRESDFVVAKDIFDRTEAVMPQCMRKMNQTPDAELYQRIKGWIGINKRLTFEQILRRFIGTIDDKRLMAMLTAAKRCGQIKATAEGTVIYYEVAVPQPNEVPTLRDKQ